MLMDFYIDNSLAINALLLSYAFDCVPLDFPGCMIACGIDVIHPLEPLQATNQSAGKTAYEGRIAFLGGIDISHVMPGIIDGVKKEVIRCIQQLATGGGFILAPSNHLQADVPPENVINLYKAPIRYGEYPIT